MLTQIHDKKNEIQEVEFFEDAECTVPFDFTGKMHLYLQADIATLLELLATHQVDFEAEIFVPRLPNFWYELHMKCLTRNSIITLDDITPNLSKYIPEDNILMFIGSVEDLCKFNKIKTKYTTHHAWFCNEENKWIIPEPKQSKKLTIFLPHGTQSALQKAEEVKKELKEKYEVEKVNLFVKDWFLPRCYEYNIAELTPEWFEAFCTIQDDFNIANNIDNIKDSFNKIITTNSTSILKPKDSNDRFKVLDCKDIFEEYLKENN